MVENKIRALFIFEILGRPAEYLKESLNALIDKLAEAKGIKIESRKIQEPKLIEKENVKDIYTTFAEVELTADNLGLIFDITLNMLPAHVEIIEPEHLSLKNFDLSSVLANLAIKLHRFDEIAKTITIEKNILMARLKEMQEKINELEKSKEKNKDKEKSEKKKANNSKDKKNKKK